MPKPNLKEDFIITDEKCSYGCNNNAAYAFENGKFCCSRTSNGCSAMIAKNRKGLKKAHASGKFRNRKIDYDSVAKNVSITRTKKLLEAKWDDLKYTAKKNRVKLEQDNTCLHCGINEWQGKPIVIEIDHVNGDRTDNSRKNLRGLCPNCHSQTETWKGRNIKPKCPDGGTEYAASSNLVV